MYKIHFAVLYFVPFACGKRKAKAALIKIEKK